MSAKRFAELGEINQIAFIPEDFDAALRFWVEAMGAGPFFLIRNAAAEVKGPAGTAAGPVLDLALGHWGDIQIELIRQTNDVPSPYKEWRDSGASGVHHTCIAVPDIAEAKRLATEKGMEILLNAGSNGAEWIYVDTGGGPGTIVEIIQHSAASQELMDIVRQAAQNWDGHDPVRQVGVQ